MEFLLLLIVGAIIISFSLASHSAWQGMRRGEVTPEEQAANPTLMESIETVIRELAESASKMEAEQRFTTGYCRWFRTFEMIVTKMLEAAEHEVAREADLRRFASEVQIANIGKDVKNRRRKARQDSLASPKHNSSDKLISNNTSSLPDAIWLASGRPKAPAPTNNPDVTEMQTRLYVEQTTQHLDFVTQTRAKLRQSPQLKACFEGWMWSFGYDELVRFHFPDEVTQREVKPTIRKAIGGATVDWASFSAAIAEVGDGKPKKTEPIPPRPSRPAVAFSPTDNPVAKIALPPSSEKERSVGDKKSGRTLVSNTFNAATHSEGVPGTGISADNKNKVTLVVAPVGSWMSGRTLVSTTFTAETHNYDHCEDFRAIQVDPDQLLAKQGKHFDTGASENATDTLKEEGKSELRAIAEARAIPHLVHFTRCENLPTILRHGLCSIVDSGSVGIRTVRNDEQRLDGAEDGISLSIAFPNYRMFYKYRQLATDADWAVLILSPRILWTKPCGFFKLNAADHRMRNRPRAEMTTPHAFRDMYEFPETVRPDWLRPYDPTDSQAEVMSYKRIEPGMIETVAFETRLARDRWAHATGEVGTIVTGPRRGMFGIREQVRQ